MCAEKVSLPNGVIKTPTRFFHVLFTLWSFVMQSGEFTGNPPNSDVSFPVGDRTQIFEFTGKDTSELGGFPVNSSDCITNDQSANNAWKNFVGCLYDTFQKRKPRRTTGGLINDVNSSFENLSPDKIRNAIDLQPKVMQAIVEANGGHTKHMSSRAAS